MAIQTRRERQRQVSDFWNRPIEWLHGRSLRLLDWFNQERWTNLLVITTLVLANLVILYFFLQGQDNRAIAFTVLALIVPLALLIPELSIIAFIGAGTGLFVHTMYYAIGSAGGWTGGRTITLMLFMVLFSRALYEYFQTPAAERPRLVTVLTVVLFIYWVYHMAHVAYIYVFRYDQPPPASNPEQVLGYERFRLMRYFDYYIYWMSIPLMMFMLRDWARARRVLWGLGILMGLGAIVLVWEYLAPLPIFVKVMFQMHAAGETTEGYRVRNPASLYLILVGFFAALYLLGYARGWKNALIIGFIIIALFGIMITKNRILWGGLLLILPFALLLKSPTALLRQTQSIAVALLVAGAAMLHPPIAETVSRLATETWERWSRSFAYGGNPTQEGSYQARIREREAWERHYAQLNTFQRLFGAGLEAQYGFFVTLRDIGYEAPRYDRIYVEKAHMHFAWLYRLLQVGLIGTSLLALVLLTFYLRSAYLFWRTRSPVFRAIIVGVVGSMTGILAFDSLHLALSGDAALPTVLLWAAVELVPHWEAQLQPSPAQGES